MNYSLKTEKYLHFPDIDCGHDVEGMQVWNSGSFIDFGYRDGLDPVFTVPVGQLRAFAQALLDHADELIGEEDETI